MIFLFGALGGAAIVVWAKNWAIMPDELIYVTQSRQLLDGVIPLPLIGGTREGLAVSYQQLYPLLISPLVGLLRMPDAYPWIAVLNVWLMASAAIPAYLIASRTTASRAIARWVALCVVITPWIALTSKVIPDAAAYAAFTWALYAIIRTSGAAERTLKGDLLAWLALTLAFAMRNQFLLLIGVWVFAVCWSTAAGAAAEAGLRGIGRALLRLPLARPIPIGVFAAVALMYVFKPGLILGYYLATTTTATEPTATTGLLPELLSHANAVAFGTAALPLVLGLPWIFAALGRLSDRRQNDAAAVILLTTVIVIYVGATFDMRFDPGERVIERYIFYIAPLWFVAMGAFFARPPKSLPGFALPALLGVVVLIATEPYGLDTALGRIFNQVFSPTQVWLIQWQHAAELIGSSISGLVVLLMLLWCAGVWWLLTHGRTALAQTLGFSFVALLLLASALTIAPATVDAQNSAAVSKFGQRTSAQKAWVEQAAGGSPWAAVYSPGSLVQDASRFSKRYAPTDDRERWRDVAFWNAGRSTTYSAPKLDLIQGTAIPGVVQQLVIDWPSGAIPRAPGDDSKFLLLATDEQHFAPQPSAEPIASKHFTLYPVGDRIAAAWAAKGITPKGWIFPGGATLRVYSASGAAAAARVKVRVNAHPMGKRKSVVIEQAVVRVPAGGHADLAITRGAAPMRITRVDVAPINLLRR